MERILLVSATEKSRTMLSQFLTSCGVQAQLAPASSGAEARRMLVDGLFDLVLVNTPLPDEFGHDMAQQAANDTLSGVILLAKAEIADSVAEKVEDDGEIVVPTPLSRELIMQARQADRAMCLLIECCGMTEPEAHSYFELQAMNQRRSKRDIAEDIIGGKTP